MAKTTYMWDELSDNVVAEYEDGVLAAAYTHELGLYGNLLSQNRNGVTSYYHYDGRGDTVALTDDSGNVTDTKEYDAWGNVIASTGSTETPYQFGGRQGYQTGYSRVYVRVRMYQPTIGRLENLNPGDSPNSSDYSFSSFDMDSSMSFTVRQGRDRGGLTCKSARAKLEKLLQLWKDRGFTYSVMFLELFLDKRGGRSNPTLDMSKVLCSKIIDDAEFKKGLFDHLTKDGCSAGSEVIPPELPVTEPYPFDVEWLKPLAIAWDFLNDLGSFDDLNDFAYLVGTGHFGHGTLSVSRKRTSNGRTCCCTIDVSGNVLMKDSFGFPNQPERGLSPTWLAGVYLQRNCPGYKPVAWEVKCPIEQTYRRCSGPVHNRVSDIIYLD